MTANLQNAPHTSRLQDLMGHVKNGNIAIEGLFPVKRLYRALAVFSNDEGTMFMMIGEHNSAFALFEASQYNDWSFHSGHSSLEGALNEIRDFRLKRIS